MSDGNNFDFKGLSDDAELEALLESVRRDIGEASPEPRQKGAPARAKAADAPAESAPAPKAQSEASPAPSAPRRAQAQQISQPRPQGARRAPDAASAAQRPARAAVETPERPAPANRERPMPPERERIRVVHPEEEPRERKSRFGLAFAIYAIVLLLVLAAGCVVLWFYLDAYEATLPGHVMDEFTELADEAYWSDALEGAFTVGETPFEDRDELLEELCMSVLRSNPLEYREDEGYSADNMVYLVSAGGRDVCRVTVDELTENGNAGFGFTYLAVTRVELLASFTAPEQYEIDITAPADAAVYVNGVLVTPDYAVSAGEITAEGLGELEEGLADELFTAYHIGGLYAPVEVSAAGADGSALAAEGEAEDNAVAFSLGEGTLDYRILVPEGASVSVNGVELDESYDTGDTIVPAFLDGFEIYGTLPELELWLVEGLHVEPEITVTAAGGEMGEPITDGSELVYLSGADSATESAHREEAAAFANAYVDYLSGEAAADADYTALQGKVLDGSALETALSELHDAYEADGRTVEHVYVRSGSFVSIGATCYVCTVDVDYAPAADAAEDAEGERASSTAVFVMYGGIWQAAAVTC